MKIRATGSSIFAIFSAWLNCISRSGQLTNVLSRFIVVFTVFLELVVAINPAIFTLLVLIWSCRWREREIRLMTLPPLLIIPQKAQTKTLQMEKPIVCMCSLLKEKKREEERRKRRRQQAAEKRQSILRALAATCHLSLCLRLLLANW